MKRRDIRRNKFFTLAAENLDMALRAVKSNKLRSSLTIAIIALGITSLVGILTAVDSLDATLKEAYSRMGADLITIRSLNSMPSGMAQNTQFEADIARPGRTVCGPLPYPCYRNAVHDCQVGHQGRGRAAQNQSHDRHHRH